MATIGAILGSFITLILVVKLYKGDIRALVPDSAYLLSSNVENLSNIDKVRLDRLLDKNIIFSASDLLGQLSTFYSTIITFLIAMITVTSLFTLFYVKVSTEEKAENLAKNVAKQAIDDKIQPKITDIDSRLQSFNESALETRIGHLLQIKILDSIHFWTKIEESIYRKSEESLEDYDINDLREKINKNTNDISSITSSIQEINNTIDERGNIGDETITLDSSSDDTVTPIEKELR